MGRIPYGMRGQPEPPFGTSDGRPSYTVQRVAYLLHVTRTARDFTDLLHLAYRVHMRKRRSGVS